LSADVLTFGEANGASAIEVSSLGGVMAAEEPSKAPITELLRLWSAGDKLALDRLTGLVYSDLRRLARHRARFVGADSSIQPTALVNEVYLRLLGGADGVAWRDRAHFFAIASHLMRLIAADSARFHGRSKRGGGWQRIALEDSDIPSTERQLDVLALDDALNHLLEIDPRKVQVVEMRFFGGLTNDEIAEVLSVSIDTVKRDWNFARLWLSREMRK
jgi:RNA polymerase sigma factor (TIGR02999 family)